MDSRHIELDEPVDEIRGHVEVTVRPIEPARDEGGTGHVFDLSHNRNWLDHTRPMFEAFFHARYFLEMAIRYGRKLDHPPRVLPSGWAALLCLYGLR